MDYEPMSECDHSVLPNFRKREEALKKTWILWMVDKLFAAAA